MAVTVDSDFVRVDGKSYAVSKITSVEVRTDPQLPNRTAQLWALATVLIALAAIISPLLIVAAVITGVYWYRAPKTPPPLTHHLVLMLASQEAAALATTNLYEVEALRDQIEAAMSGRLVTLSNYGELA